MRLAVENLVQLCKDLGVGVASVGQRVVHCSNLTWYLLLDVSECGPGTCTGKTSQWRRSESLAVAVGSASGPLEGAGRARVRPLRAHPGRIGRLW